MKPLLVILNPRQIPETLAALDQLRVDKVWLTGYTEPQLVPEFAKVVENTRYTHYIAVSDDGLPRQPALDAVVNHLDAGHPVVTGYSNLSADDLRVNLCKTPLPDQLSEQAYDCYTLVEALGWPTETIPTYFAGMALTGMSRRMWLDYPFRTSEYGAQSDWSLCRRLQADGVPIVAAREGFQWHLKEHYNRSDLNPQMRVMIGEIQPQVRWDRQQRRKVLAA